MKKVSYFAFFFVLFQLMFNYPTKAFAYTTEKKPSIAVAGSVYDDLYGDYGSLGIASKFHIFAEDKVVLNTHTNGNIAAANFEGNVNFGTNIHEGLVTKEIHYLKKVNKIVPSSFVSSTKTRTTKLVIGKNNECSFVDNGKFIAVNGTKLDHLDRSEIFQDSSKNYIDFNTEFRKLEGVSQRLSSSVETVAILDESFSDVNNRIIDLSNKDGDTLFVNIDANVLTKSTNLKIKNSDSKMVVMNVSNIPNNLYVHSKIVYNNRMNKETEDFSDANIIWNFGNKDQTININAPFQGSILSPNSTIIANQNLDGNIITKNVTINAESHRWDPNPINLKSTEPSSTEPSSTESSSTESSSTEPSSTESSSTESSSTESSSTESSSTESSSTEPSSTESSSTEPSSTESSSTEPSSTESSSTESSSTEPSSTESSSTEPSSTESSSTESSSTEPSSTESSSTESSSTESSSTEPSSTESSSTESSSTEPSSTESSSTEPSSTESSSTEPSSTESSSTESSSTESSSTEPSSTEPSSTEPSSTEPSSIEPSSTDQSNNSKNKKEERKLPLTGYMNESIFTILGAIIIFSLVKYRFF